MLLKSQCLKSLKYANCPIYNKKAKIICPYNSHAVLCGGCIYSLYIDAVVVLARDVWLVIVRNNKICTVQALKIMPFSRFWTVSASLRHRCVGACYCYHEVTHWL